VIDEHHTADHLSLLRASFVPYGQCSGREREHHDREESGHEDAGLRIAREEPVQVAVNAIVLAQDEPHDRVEDVMQSQREQQPVGYAVKRPRRRRCSPRLPDPFR
jgi:methyl coenzyme M reductase subunit D